MLVSPNNRTFGYSLRFLVIAFSATVFFLVTTKSNDQGALVVYFALLSILMIFCQKATEYSVNNGKSGCNGGDENPSNLDVLAIYFLSLVIVFARSVLGIAVPNFVYFLADALTFGAIIFGFAVTYRRR